MVDVNRSYGRPLYVLLCPFFMHPGTAASVHGTQSLFVLIHILILDHQERRILRVEWVGVSLNLYMTSNLSSDSY